MHRIIERIIQLLIGIIYKNAFQIGIRILNTWFTENISINLPTQI